MESNQRAVHVGQTVSGEQQCILPPSPVYYPARASEARFVGSGCGNAAASSSSVPMWGQNMPGSLPVGYTGVVNPAVALGYGNNMGNLVGACGSAVGEASRTAAPGSNQTQGQPMIQAAGGRGLNHVNPNSAMKVGSSSNLANPDAGNSNEQNNIESTKGSPSNSGVAENRSGVSQADEGKIDDIIVKLLCRFGGKLMPRRMDSILRYVGGHTRIVSVRKEVKFDELVEKMANFCARPFTIKYQLPGGDLDPLITVSCQEDVDWMIDEYVKFFEKSPYGNNKLRVFLFSAIYNRGIVPFCNLHDNRQRYQDSVNPVAADAGGRSSRFETASVPWNLEAQGNMERNINPGQPRSTMAQRMLQVAGNVQSPDGIYMGITHSEEIKMHPQAVTIRPKRENETTIPQSATRIIRKAVSEGMLRLCFGGFPPSVQENTDEQPTLHHLKQEKVNKLSDANANISRGINDSLYRASPSIERKKDTSMLLSKGILSGVEGINSMPASLLGQLNPSNFQFTKPQHWGLQHEIHNPPNTPNYEPEKTKEDFAAKDSDVLVGDNGEAQGEDGTKLRSDSSSEHGYFVIELADGIMKKEFGSAAEGVVESVPPSATSSHEQNEQECEAKEASHTNIEVPQNAKIENINTSKSEKVDIVLTISNDIDHLQIIKNSDLRELQELGSGIFGTVYRGEWKGSEVAIKWMYKKCIAGNPSEEDCLVYLNKNDFLNDMIKLAILRHPNVVEFYGAVLDGPGDSAAMVTEYMVDGSLKKFLRTTKRGLDQHQRVWIAMDVAIGMEYLHGKHVLHFNLKSDNLLVNLRDPQRPKCKVGDLGMSRAKCRTLISGGGRGTLPWMAPELFNGSGNLISEKVDVFSYGIVMWELLTGEEPYADIHYGALIGGIVSNTLRPPVPESCEPEWRALMERCWAAEPSERPSFTEIAEELRCMAARLPCRAQMPQDRK